MSLYKYIRELWKQPKENLGEINKQRLIKWRRQPSTVRIERPTRLDRARSLGYKAKPGILIIRQRVLRGGHSLSRVGKGRKSKHYKSRVDLEKSYQVVAEQRVARKYKANCEVLNSYWVGKDGKNYWFEVILLDKSHPVIKNDAYYSQIVAQKGRAFRGLTSAARKSRGLRHTGKGTEKMRPSMRAVAKRKNLRRETRTRLRYKLGAKS
ncbi:50S ribosomal protein L15e [Candidatus Woesearchaeota archaeon]|nr:50S ribosomal protein L15e [Candidatus Woesearchaeota archaeon]